MPVQYEINNADRLLVTRGAGTVTDAELRRCVDLIAWDDRFSSGLDQLGDYRGVTSARGVSIDFLRELAKQWQLDPGTRRAYVAESADTVALLHAFEVFSSWGGGQVRVFRSLDTALRWLGRMRLSIPRHAW